MHNLYYFYDEEITMPLNLNGNVTIGTQSERGP